MASMQNSPGSQPPRTLLPDLERLLASRPPHVAEAVRRVVTDVRPCVRLVTTRATSVPLRGRLIDRVLGRPRPEPTSPVITSKFGGVPYAESASDLDGGRFIGQINFAEAHAALSAQNFPIPQDLPSSGLLAVDFLPKGFTGRTRWYPEPLQAKAVRPTTIESIAKYEARIGFAGSWSMQSLDWYETVPEGDDELWDHMNNLEIPGVDEDARDGHKLFGHPNEALNDHYGLQPAPGRSDSIRDYALVWRIDYDNEAGFAWGTNWLYVVIHADDFRNGNFKNAIVTGANA